MDNKCIRVGIVNYLNTLPLLFGLEKMHNASKIVLIKNYPAAIADDLLNGNIDAGLIPIAMIPRLKQAYIIGNYCISSYDTVASVCLFSQVPIENITTVILDYQSRTSVQLVQVLMKQFWKKEVTYLTAKQNFIADIKDNTAAVIIGDRALENLNYYNYCYDLAEAWMQMTGLPFVFALWVSNKELPAEFIAAFDAANAEGLQYIEQIVQAQNYTAYDLQKYYTQNICFTMDDARRKSVELFLSLSDGFSA